MTNSGIAGLLIEVETKKPPAVVPQAISVFD
jgi:hypothetical protein